MMNLLKMLVRIFANASDACDKTSVKMTVMNAIGVVVCRLNVEWKNNIFI